MPQLHSINVALIAIVGPTASGKSRLALHLARAFNGEIINADSRQVYRHMDIGTAKPSVDDQRLVPHHLLNIIEPDVQFDLATFLRLAKAAIRDITGRRRLPIVVGGTGQYVWALLEGWQVPTGSPDPSLRRALQEEARLSSPETLHRRLANVDPQAAARIHPRNVRRVIRALEVHQSSQGLTSGQRAKHPPSFRSLVLGLTLERQALYQQIDQRVDEMVDRGLVEEVRHLLEMGYSPDFPAFSSAGYREMALHLQGQLPLGEAIQQIKYATHRLVRRQYSWFRPADSRIHWLDAATDPLPRMSVVVGEFLAGDSSCVTMGSDGTEGVS